MRKTPRFPARVKVEASPVSTILRRLQQTAGWSTFIDDDLKARVIHRLDAIVSDPEMPPQISVAAASCILKACAVETESVNALARMLETTQLQDRITELERQLADRPDGDSDFIDVGPRTPRTRIDL